MGAHTRLTARANPPRRIFVNVQHRSRSTQPALKFSSTIYIAFQQVDTANVFSKRFHSKHDESRTTKGNETLTTPNNSGALLATIVDYAIDLEVVRQDSVINVLFFAALMEL